MAERTGLEPATSGVTGQHSNQLNYRSVLAKTFFVFFPNLSVRRQGPQLWAGGLDVMAERTGLEPATSGVTGQHSNQLNYRSALLLFLVFPPAWTGEKTKPPAFGRRPR